MPPARKYDTMQEKNREASRRRREREGMPVKTPRMTPAQAEKNRKMQEGRDRARKERARLARLEAARLATRAQPSHAMQSAIEVCREARRIRTAKDAVLIAEARVELEAQMAAAREQRKGGRPRKAGPSIHVGRRDPANALILALGGIE